MTYFYVRFLQVKASAIACKYKIYIHTGVFVEGYDYVMVFNATFNNSSVISRWSVLLVEKTRLPGENHRPLTNFNIMLYPVHFVMSRIRTRCFSCVFITLKFGLHV